MINTMAPDMEPAPVTDLELTVVLDELLSREPIFHRPEHGSSRADFDRMMTTDFWEIGASGKRYSRNDVLDELDRRRKNPGPDAWQTSDFQCRQLAPNLYLLTYTLLQNNERLTRRSTIWQRSAEGWKIAFHQGTIVQQPGA
jgi:hypothetical protein